ncbi:HAMP domain-containing histidine kinase [Aquihabitans sp. G128]|uniref:sensor histidine kinase n=1 Tax=Aquihabitans sp. G128 TaxID=2849779 RepID=UPI001C215820|nr:HAMP domain-containing sensor histidine kinase [Aquihabitans sp. G128]QXC59305.1 HAMP domain-containing histidine kinase [Aquihabitans sp. G128]
MGARPRRLRSLRFRISAVATLAVAVILGVGAWWLAAYTDARQTDQIDASLRTDAKVTVRFLQSKEPVPDFGPTGRIVQVVLDNGRVVGSNEESQGYAPVLRKPFPWVAHPDGGSLSVDHPDLGPLQVHYTPLKGTSGPWIVVARSSEQLDRSIHSLRNTLLAVVPLLTLVFGALIWVVVGRALRPVEAIRSTVSEITERDLAQRVQTRGNGDEVDRLAVTMNAMLARLERAAGRERQLVADVSHELRSPLASARALIETRPADPADAAEHDAAALDALARLQALVDQLLELARHELPTPTPSRSVDLDDLVLQHADILRRTTALAVDTSAVSGGQVLGSAEALGRLVDNLASNAARHARSAVQFAVAEADGIVELVVADDGAGIPVEHREAVFDRFTRLDDARARAADETGGLGLGLAIVARIAERHGGTVRAGARPDGTGATITVRLPVAAPPGPDEPLPSA